jgi:hypothetical protein
MDDEEEAQVAEVAAHVALDALGEDDLIAAPRPQATSHGPWLDLAASASTQGGSGWQLFPSLISPGTGQPSAVNPEAPPAGLSGPPSLGLQQLLQQAAHKV